jgi:hypothetical protein
VDIQHHQETKKPICFVDGLFSFQSEPLHFQHTRTPYRTQTTFYTAIWACFAEINIAVVRWCGGAVD